MGWCLSLFTKRRRRNAAAPIIRQAAIDALEGRQLLAAAPVVTNLTLINADTDKAINIALTKNGTATIDLKTNRHLNISAAVTNTKSVKFGYDSNTNFLTESVAPYAFAADDSGNYRSWTPTVGTHTITATPFASTGAIGTAGAAYKVTIKVVDSSTTTGGTTNTPYLGTAPSLPANTVLFANFDYGGEGVAYHDTDSTNAKGDYRAGGVDLETNSDATPSGLLSQTGAGHSVGNVRAGEWLKYTVKVTTAGTYAFDLRYASGSTGGTAHLEVDGSNVSGSIALTSTGGWQSWKTLEKTITLPAGQHVLRFFIDKSTAGGDVANLNWFRLKSSGNTTPPTQPASSVAWPSSWTQTNNAPSPRFEAAYHVFGGKIYAFGGFKNTDFDVDRTYVSYNPDTNVWTKLGTLPVGMAETHTGLADDGHYIYFVGGFAGDLKHGVNPSQVASAAVWRFEPSTNTWTKFATLPAARGAGGAVIVGRRLYYTGGNPADRVTNLSSTLWLDLDNPSKGWTFVAGAPDPKDHQSVLAIGTKIYAFGGEHGHDKLADTSKTAYVYDTVTDKWTRLADMLFTDGHTEGGTSIVDGWIVMAGGQDDHAQDSTSRVQAYNPVTNKWVQLKSLPVARQGSVVAVFGNKVILALGAQYTSYPQSGVWIGYR